MLRCSIPGTSLSARTICPPGRNRTHINALPARLCLCPWEESNPHLGLRSPLLYPLSYRGIYWQAGKSAALSIELRRALLRSGIIPKLRKSMYHYILGTRPSEAQMKCRAKEGATGRFNFQILTFFRLSVKKICDKIIRLFGMAYDGSTPALGAGRPSSTLGIPTK